MIFLFPLVMSIAAAIFLVINGGFGWIGKLAVVGLVVGSIVLQFGALAHFMVPLAMQLFVCFWYLLDRKLNG